MIMSQPVQQFFSEQILTSLETEQWDNIFEVRRDILSFFLSFSSSLCLPESESCLTLLQTKSLFRGRKLEILETFSLVWVFKTHQIGYMWVPLDKSQVRQCLGNKALRMWGDLPETEILLLQGWEMEAGWVERKRVKGS